MRAQRIQDRICTLAKEGRWQEIVAEKRAALQQIKHTLDTYHRLLTQAPVPADGVLKLLQSIVRCAAVLCRLPGASCAHDGRLATGLTAPTTAALCQRAFPGHTAATR